MKIKNHIEAADWAGWLRLRGYTLLNDYKGLDEIYEYSYDYIGLDEIYGYFSKGHTILFFDGTDGKKEWRNNFDTEIEMGYHTGFYEEAKKFESYYLENLSNFKTERLTLICYSRGVIGLIWALEQTFVTCDIDIYLFGCPMVSNGPLSIPKNIKITKIEKYGDIIPYLPAGYHPLPYNEYYKLGKWWDVLKFWRCKHREYIE